MEIRRAALDLNVLGLHGRARAGASVAGPRLAVRDEPSMTRGAGRVRGEDGAGADAVRVRGRRRGGARRRRGAG